MSLLDANADSLRSASLNTYYDPGKRPEPGILDSLRDAGKNFLPGTGSYFMRGMAESGRALSMAGAAVPVLADKLIGSDNRGESFGDRYFRWHDETFNRAVDYWTPKPGEVGAAGQVVGSLAAGLTQFLANPALLIGTSQLSTAEDLVRQGVDAGAANVAGDVAGLSTVAGIALPIFGKTLVGKIATGAAGNLATNIPQAAITRAVVQASGAPKGVAEQFDPFDVRARLVDLLMGIAFGAKSHLDAHLEAKQKAFIEGGIPSKPTAIADAAAKAFESPLTATQRDAVMVMNAARHLDEAALPWRAGEAEHTAAVDNVRTAIAQISRGQAVDVPSLPAGSDDASFASRLDAAIKDRGISVIGGDRSFAGGEAGARSISIADMPETEFMATHGATPTDVKAHEFAHAFWAGATALPNFRDPANKPLLSELRTVSQEFRPFVWETHKAHANKPGELMADGMAFWIKYPERRGEFPLLDKMMRSYDAGDLQRRFPSRESGLSKSIAESAPKSAEPVATPEMRVHDVEKAMKTAQTLSATIDAVSTDPATRVRLLKSEAKRLRSTADTAPTPDIAAHAKMAADMLENRAVFADDLRVPSGEFDPKTGDPLTISANEYVAKAAAEAEHVKATAEGLMRTVATCILGGI